MAAATAAIAQNEARVVFAERELERTRELVDRQIGTREQLDARISECQVALAVLTIAGLGLIFLTASLILFRRSLSASR